MGKYDETSVVKALKAKNGVKVDTVLKTVKINAGAHVGNSTYGKVDFLCNYCGYTKTVVNEELKAEQISFPVESSKQQKRDAKAANLKRAKK